MSEERLSNIDAMIQKSIENKEIPGAVALIARNGKIIYHKAFGSSHPTNENPYQVDHIFRISLSNQSYNLDCGNDTWEQGLFQLDDPISKYIPEFEEPTILDRFNEEDSSYTTTKAENQITIRHLLTHTSGIDTELLMVMNEYEKFIKKLEL